jgi:HSP20 family protein
MKTMQRSQRCDLSPLFTQAASAFHHVCWRPAADVYRTRSGWLVKFDLAGVRLEDIHLEVQGRTLSVAGVRRDWVLEEGYQYHALEIAYCEFERQLTFPTDLEHARLTTQYHDGMLLVHLQTEGERP